MDSGDYPTDIEGVFDAEFLAASIEFGNSVWIEYPGTFEVYCAVEGFGGTGTLSEQLECDGRGTTRYPECDIGSQDLVDHARQIVP